MPAQSAKQQRLMAAEYERVKEGKKPQQTKGMSQAQRHDFMKKEKK